MVVLSDLLLWMGVESVLSSQGSLLSAIGAVWE
jgi:hypothetical protein